jgi:DNA-binding CsgD family transcriptional regulator/sugar-specific transcriptional regulator TrmB
MFEVLGLDDFCELVYRTTLTYPNPTIAELADVLDLPPSEIRVAVEDLARLSLLRPTRNDAEKLRPVSPDLGLASLFQRHESELSSRLEKLKASRAEVAVLVSEYEKSRPTISDSEAEVLIGADAVRDRLEELVYRCQHEVLSLVPGGSRPAANTESSRGPDADALGRGVVLRRIYLNSVRNDPTTLNHTRWIVENGGKIRTAPALPIGLIIIDRNLVLLPLLPEPSGEDALIMRNASVVAAMVALFGREWESAVPLDASIRRDNDGLTDLERKLMELLTHGHTDDVIARRLGVSVRTSRRITADLMKRLGAQSRFQAGALAANRGWITPDP